MNKLQFTLPFLRFKEFSDDYIFIKLDQISELQKNGSLSKTDIHNQGKFKCILYGELFTTYDSIIKSESILSKTNKKSKLLTNSNCIVFPSSSTTLVDFFPCSSIKTSGVMLGQDINCFFVNYKNSSDYLSYFFSKKSNKIKIFRLTEGSTINHLYGNYLKSFTMCISNNIKEQIKISKFFSLLDKHIELWERKLQLYLLKKKYHLYNMFCSNNNLPFLRFKEFKKNLVNFSYINDVSEIKNGVGFPIIFQEKSDSKISFYKVSDLNQSSREINSLFSIDYKNIERLNSKPFFKPSICFAKIGEACKLNRKKVISSNFYFIDNNMSSLIPFDTIEFYYFYYFLCKLNFNSFIKTSNLPSIDIDMLKNHKIFYPDIKEQIKISKFFLLLDNNIKLSQENIDNLKIKKLFYINKMFI